MNMIAIICIFFPSIFLLFREKRLDKLKKKAIYKNNHIYYFCIRH